MGRALPLAPTLALPLRARPWDEYVRAAVEAGSDAAARVRGDTGRCREIQGDIGGLRCDGTGAAMYTIHCIGDR